MNTNPLITIIIPTYNSEAYIADAIESVLGQTYRNSEIIVVDDGSTDNTAQAVKPYEGRIKYIVKKNGGPASARNIGLKEAKGEFIAFLDSDDIWLPTKLDKQLKVMQENPAAGLVACSEYEINTEREVVGTVKYFNHSDKDKFIRDMLVKNRVGGGSTAMVRRTCFDKAGVFDENLRGTEDWDMWLRLALQFDVRFVEDPLIQARVRPNSVSSLDNADKMLHNELKLLDKIFSDQARSCSPSQKARSYSYRYFAAAKTNKQSGRMKEARQYLGKAFSIFPQMFLSEEGFKVTLMVLWMSVTGKK